MLFFYYLCIKEWVNNFFKMLNMNRERLSYPDICKFLAIFIVTWSHCAQCISGLIWTNFWGGFYLDIAFTMPLFMLMSGWFIDPDKMRKVKIQEYVLAKFRRLIIPSFIWYFLLLVFSFNFPDLSLFTYYWYLNALFVCLCVIMICAKVFKSNTVCCFVSISIILLIPYSDFSHINFMIPFLWAGYGLRKICTMKCASIAMFACFVIGLCLCLLWNYKYSVYSSPFNSICLNYEMVKIMIYRFALGFTLSAVIIYLIIRCENTWICRFAHYGSYTLVIYTSSLACLALVSRVLNSLNIHTNMYFVIDIVSLCLCFILIAFSIRFADFCRKNKLLSLLFLGE